MGACTRKIAVNLLICIVNLSGHVEGRLNPPSPFAVRNGATSCGLQSFLSRRSGVLYDFPSEIHLFILLDDGKLWFRIRHEANPDQIIEWIAIAIRPDTGKQFVGKLIAYVADR